MIGRDIFPTKKKTKLKNTAEGANEDKPPLAGAHKPENKRKTMAVSKSSKGFENANNDKGMQRNQSNFI